MKKTILFITVMVLLTALMISASAADSIDIAYGNGVISAVRVESFAECEIPTSSYGDMYSDNGLGFFSQNIVDRYCITMPEAAENTEAFKNAKYVIIKFKNLSDGDIYFCYQPSTDGVNSSFIYSVGDEPIRLVSSDGIVTDAVFTDTPSVNNRYAITVSADFDGYIIIPLEDIVMHGTWKSVWVYGESVITHSGFHVSYIDGESTFVEGEITGLYCAAELSVTEEAATTVASGETDSQSAIPGTSATAATDTVAFTTAEQTDKIETPTGINTKALYIIAGVCAVAVIIVVITILIKKKKH